jgi:hypothetical protein
MAVAHGSTAAWEHVNLLGEYDLSEEKFKDSVGIKRRSPKTDQLTGWSPWDLQN